MYFQPIRHIDRSKGLTMLRAAHMDLEGLVMDREVRALRDQFVSFMSSREITPGLRTHVWTRSPSATPKLYITGYTSPLNVRKTSLIYYLPTTLIGWAGEFLESCIIQSQKNINGTVRCRAYKGNFSGTLYYLTCCLLLKL